MLYAWKTFYSLTIIVLELHFVAWFNMCVDRRGSLLFQHYIRQLLLTSALTFSPHFAKLQILSGFKSKLRRKIRCIETFLQKPGQTMCFTSVQIFLARNH